MKKKETKFTNELSEEIFNLTYKYEDETITDRLYKVAETIASVENDKDHWTEKFNEILTDFKFVPGGRILSNAGVPLLGTTFINCFVDGFMGEDQDSMEGILDALRRQALILKSEGGYGFCADVLRPRGSYISGIGNETPGAVKMLEMWDTQSAVITEGSGKKSTVKGAKGKIRKGAQMVTMSVWHPDIEEFITAKQTAGRLTKFNMSVLVTDELMDAVKNHKPWNLEFPDFDNQEFKVDPTGVICNLPIGTGDRYAAHYRNIKHVYKSHWNGDLSKWKKDGLPTKIYKTYSDANELWDLITISTYNRNEPGILFVDTINKMNNLNYCERINATNPCMVGDTLVLTSIGWIKFKNLEKYLSKGITITTMDKSGKLFNSDFKWVGVTEKQATLYRVDLDNGEFLLVNKKHKFYNENFDEVSIETLIDSTTSVISWGNKLVNILKITETNRKEDVYDLTATPNYNFFSILNHEEHICDELIYVNDNVTFNCFDIVNTNKGQLFAYQLENNHEIL